MTTLMILLAIVALVSLATIRSAFHDGRGAQRPPLSHFDDPSFHSPGFRV